MALLTLLGFFPNAPLTYRVLLAIWWIILITLLILPTAWPEYLDVLGFNTRNIKIALYNPAQKWFGLGIFFIFWRMAHAEGLANTQDGSPTHLT